MTDKTRTTPNHPREKGQVERPNRVKDVMLSKYCDEKPQHWNSFSPYLTFVENSTVHWTPGVTPYSMIFERETQ